MATSASVRSQARSPDKQAALSTAASSSWHRKMAPGPAPWSRRPSNARSRTSSRRWRAALPLVRAAPCLFGNRPALHPVGKSRIAVVRLSNGGNGCGWGAPATLIRAAFAMNPTAPLLLGDRPARLPIREPIRAVVRICWSRRLRRLAANVVVTAAPLLLGAIPSEILAHRTIVWINRAYWGRRRCGSWKWWRDRTRRRGWPRRRRSGGRRGRRRGEWRGRDRRCRLWQSRSRATPPNGHAAIVLLRLRPCHLDHVVSPTPIEAGVHPEPRVHPTLGTEPAIIWERR